MLSRGDLGALRFFVAALLRMTGAALLRMTGREGNSGDSGQFPDQISNGFKANHHTDEMSMFLTVLEKV